MPITAELKTMTPTSSKQIARFLLEIGAVKFNVTDPFVWTSGIKSPIYCDNRIINSKVPVRDFVVDTFTNTISEKYLSEIDLIAGVATGGMTYGVLIASRLNLPFIYVRPAKKEYGLKRMVEGEYSAGQKVVLIEDHISKGGSSMVAIKGLREVGIEVVCLLSIMTYNFQEAKELYLKEHVNHESLCDLDTILKVAEEEGKLSSNDVATILSFRNSPDTWHP